MFPPGCTAPAQRHEFSRSRWSSPRICASGSL